MHSDQRGRSLIEIVFVSAFISMLLTVGATNIRQALAREELEGWVRAITNDITAAQQAAITRRATVTATFQNNTYTIGAGGGGVLRQDTLPAHITFGSTLQSFSFDRRGTPSSAYTLTMTSTTTGRTFTISIEPVTGRATHSDT